MVTRAQQILLKRAQAAAGVDDGDYRDMIATVSGLADCRSSKDPRLTDEHLDKLLAWLEVYYWRQSDLIRRPSDVFRTPGYWVTKNRKGNTSRDRFNQRSEVDLISALEAELGELGYGDTYCAAIRRSVGARNRAYIAALTRTLESKRGLPRAVPADNQPF